VNPTIQRSLRTKPVTKDNLADWASQELIPFLGQVKLVADQIYQTATVPFATAHTGAFTTVWTSPDLAVGFDWFIDATIMAHVSTARSAWIIRGMFTNPGVVAQEGATVAVYTQSVAVFAVRFLVVANHVEVQVQDDGALSPTWQAWIALRENP
jgi:hypothetical protein